MTELKTLKDIEGVDYRNINTNIARLLLPSDLRAEAVKWIKFYDDDKKGLMRECFMSFFNITEEDLEQQTSGDKK